MSTEAQMKIGALAPWYGGKRTLAPVIVQELGKHKAYWELLCGSAALLFAKPRASMEVINDLHGDLINLARVVASDSAPELFERAQRTLMHHELFEECKSACYDEVCDIAPSINEVSDEHVARAWQFLVVSWQARNGGAGTVQSNTTFARRYTHNGGAGGLRWQSAVDSIPAWFERLRGVLIMREDAIGLAEKIGDQTGCVIYADPPYLIKSDKYIHDFDWLAHRRLAKALARFQKARVVVSYYDHPDLAQLYAGWTKRLVPVTKALVNQGKRDVKGETVKAPEVLLINGPSYATEATA